MQPSTVAQIVICTVALPCVALEPMAIDDYAVECDSLFNYVGPGNEVTRYWKLTDDDFSEPFDARLFEKLKFDGMNEENFAWVKDQSLNKVGLTKLALQHCDGVVQATEHVSEEILALVKESGLPFLPYQSDVMKNADAMKAFYESL